MTTVDSKGRVVLPKEVRDRLDIAPGTEVEIEEEDGRVVVKPEKDPDRIVERLESLVEDAAEGRATPDYDDLDVHARKHADAIRRQANDDGE